MCNRWISERLFTAAIFSTATSLDAEAARYAGAYAACAWLETYRAFPANEKFKAGQPSAIGLSLVPAPGETPFEKPMPGLAEALRDHGCANV